MSGWAFFLYVLVFFPRECHGFIHTRLGETTSFRNLYSRRKAIVRNRLREIISSGSNITIFGNDISLLNRADGMINNPSATLSSLPSIRQTEATTRRTLLGLTLMSIGATTSTPTSALPWSSSPVNKRSGITVFDAERYGYTVPFITYLSRFLLNFDADCQRWWYTRAADLPRRGTSEEVNKVRLQQFAAFSASVEVGLQEYEGRDGPRRLMEALVRRYCPDGESLRRGEGVLNPAEEARQQREIKEARRQIALLFGLMEVNQPVEEMTRLLAGIDNATITYIVVNDPGSGYAPGYGPPLVKIDAPSAGEGFETATGRAVLRPNGQILRIDVKNRGGGYVKPPTVTVSPPKGPSDKETKAAKAQAVVFRSGPNKGKIERIELMEPGSGYTESDVIQITLSPPSSEGGITATATAVLEYCVASIQITRGGSGYAAERTFPVYVEPPPLTARLNMNDPLIASKFPSDQAIPPTNFKRSLKAESFAESTDGCIGRACYDTPVKATAYARAERDTFYSFRFSEDMRLEEVEKAADASSYVSATSSGGGEGRRNLYWAESSTSANLLQLIPAGVGLEYNTKLKRYTLALGQSPESMGKNWMQGSAKKPLDPDFGPRGRSPIEKEAKLNLGMTLRFCASGAICCSGVHLILTPIDVVKTKVQTDPIQYPNILSAFQTVWTTEGPGTFFTGWAPTFTGYFFWGGASYAITEFVRRFLENQVLDTLGASAFGNLEVPIILSASAIGAFVGSFVICPFEAVRIRSVAQPDYAEDILGVLNRIVEEEGVPSLFSAVPAFLLKEIPFAMAKFTVFDLSTAKLYEMFPAAREDIQLSLLISLAGGTLGGIAAAIVSNPADCTISEMKKAKSDIGPIDAAKGLFERGGVGALFKGLGLRFVFYSILVSLQFFVYDFVRFTLGIGTDDLKLYLDVLGGALSQTGGPA